MKATLRVTNVVVLNPFWIIRNTGIKILNLPVNLILAHRMHFLKVLKIIHLKLFGHKFTYSCIYRIQIRLHYETRARFNFHWTRTRFQFNLYLSPPFDSCGGSSVNSGWEVGETFTKISKKYVLFLDIFACIKTKKKLNQMYKSCHKIKIQPTKFYGPGYFCLANTSQLFLMTWYLKYIHCYVLIKGWIFWIGKLLNFWWSVLQLLNKFTSNN